MDGDGTQFVLSLKMPSSAAAASNHNTVQHSQQKHHTYESGGGGRRVPGVQCRFSACAISRNSNSSQRGDQLPGSRGAPLWRTAASSPRTALSGHFRGWINKPQYDNSSTPAHSHHHDCHTIGDKSKRIDSFFSLFLVFVFSQFFVCADFALVENENTRAG